MYRQGDILIIAATEAELDEAQKAGEKIARDNGQLIIAYGETSGHAHAIREDQVETFATKNGQVIYAPIPFSVVHEEHTPVLLPAGIFRVIRQREYAPGDATFSTVSRIISD